MLRQLKIMILSHVLASTGFDKELHRVLINGNIDVDDQDNNGRTLLMTASEAGHYGCVKVLLEHGANVAKVHNCGMTALMFACLGGYPTCVALLIKNGADVNQRNDEYGRNDECIVLAQALYHSNVMVIASRAWNFEQDSPCDSVKDCHKNCRSCVRLLLEAGVDPTVHISNRAGTPMQLATTLGLDDIAWTLHRITKDKCPPSWKLYNKQKHKLPLEVHKIMQMVCGLCNEVITSDYARPRLPLTLIQHYIVPLVVDEWLKKYLWCNPPSHFDIVCATHRQNKTLFKFGAIAALLWFVRTWLHRHSRMHIL